MNIPEITTTSSPAAIIPTLFVDFNMLGATGCSYRRCLPAATDHWDLVLGQKVCLKDADGYRCDGRVRAIHDGWAEVHAHLSTWKEPL